MNIKHPRRKLILSILFFILFSAIFIGKANQVDTANLTSASATLTNNRLSFLGASHTAAAGSIAIGVTASSYFDDDTTHLYPNDTIYIGATSPSYTVKSIISSTYFSINSGLGASIALNTDLWVKQTTRATFSVGLATTVPANGYVKVTIPDAASNTNDQKPDSANLASNGFDLNGIGISDASVSGGSGCTWSTTDPSETLTAGSGSGHTYKNITTTACNGGTLTIIVGGTSASTGLLNPAPAQDRSARGTGDIYTFTIATFTSTDLQLDTVDVKVALMDGILVSATVDETLSFTLAGVTASGQTVSCITTDVTSTTTEVPWGTISTSNSFLNAAHLLTVSTNADGGYTLTAEELDQLKREGATCTGGNQSESSSCIKNTACDGGSCTQTSEDDWETATNNGFGYSLRNSSGTDAAFSYNAVSGSCIGTSSTDFCARPFSDAADAQAGATIMSNTGPVNGSAAYVCYRISVSAIQPAGYYTNVLRYIATPTF